jgi:hypothetical protein
MSFKIEHENKNKNIKVHSVEDSIDDIKFTKKSPIVESMSSNFYEKFEEPEDDIGLDFIANPNKRIDSEPDPEPEYQRSDMSAEEADSDIMMQPTYSEDGEELSYEEIQQQKAYYLTQLKLYADKGKFPSRRLGPEHPLSDIKAEVFKIRKEIEITRGINFCRMGLMCCVGTIEFLNTSYDPSGGYVDLNGWTAQTMADKEDYDEVFQELYEKYAGNVSMAPEIKLISMVLGSAFAFNLAKLGISAQAMKGSNNGGGGFSNLMGMFGGVKPSGQASSEPSKKMKGPSVDTDELLRKLNDDMSDTMSTVSEIPPPEEKVIKVPAKRGRKPKSKNN